MSKAERVLPPGRSVGSTAGGAGRPVDNVRLLAPPLAVRSVVWRKGGPVAFGEDVPPTPQVQNTPPPPPRAVPSRKLATSNPVLALTVQPLLRPAQLEVWFWLKKNWPTMLSAFRTSRDRAVRLPPALNVWRPRMWVTLSKICRLPRFVMRG